MVKLSKDQFRSCTSFISKGKVQGNRFVKNVLNYSQKMTNQHHMLSTLRWLSAVTFATMLYSVIDKVGYTPIRMSKLVRFNYFPMDTRFQVCYRQLNLTSLTPHLARLTSVVGRALAPFLAGARLPPAEALMRRSAPEFSGHCAAWRLQSPSGRRTYTAAELTSLATQADESRQQLPVPNVAHFVLPFADRELKFHHLVCILSSVWLMRPRLLFLWHARDRPPLETDANWRELRRNLSTIGSSGGGFWETGVVMAAREVPTAIYGVPVTKPQHQADLMRLEAVLTFGGAYMDLDVVTLKPLKPLRRFPFVIGRQGSVGLCNGAFLAAPGNLMLAMWHLAYQTFDASWWAVHSVNLPDALCRGFPRLCHIEERSMHRPSWNELAWIYGRKRVWNWRATNYMVHLWYRFHQVQYNMSSICRVNSMFGDMFRYVLFGTYNSLATA